MNTATRIDVPMNVSDAHSLLRGCQSIRRYHASQPSSASIRRIFESVAHAPSAHDRQPWRYMVLSGFAAKGQLALAMGRRLAVDHGRDNDASDAIRQDAKRSRLRITGAPVVIIVALSMAEMDCYPDSVPHSSRAHAGRAKHCHGHAEFAARCACGRPRHMLDVRTVVLPRRSEDGAVIAAGLGAAGIDHAWLSGSARTEQIAQDDL